MRSVVDLLKLHEGFRLHPYQCTAGAWTIGYGHNLDANPLTCSIDHLHGYGISKSGAERLLIADIEGVVRNLETIDEFSALDEVRRAVLIDMCFNLGFRGLLGFKRMWAAISNKDYRLACLEMMTSRWAHQVGQRAYRLGDMMISGEWPQ